MGLQARASVAFWAVCAVTPMLLILPIKRAGRTGIAAMLDSVVRFIPAHTDRGIAIALVAVGVFQQAAVARSNAAPNPSLFLHYPSADCSLWLRTAEDGIVMAQQASIIHRLTGRKVVSFPVSSDPQFIVSVARRENVRYLVVNDEVEVKDEYFFPSEMDRFRVMERAYPSMFVLVNKGLTYRVFELIRSYPANARSLRLLKTALISGDGARQSVLYA